MKLTLEKAKELLNHAKEVAKKDGFIGHCNCVGDTAAVIAKAIGLENPDYARALGYVHDIGKHLNEDNVEWHDVLGFQYLLSQGIDEQDAWICMTHSYINGDYRCEAGGNPQGTSLALREAACPSLQYLRRDYQSLRSDVYFRNHDHGKAVNRPFGEKGDT